VAFRRTHAPSLPISNGSSSLGSTTICAALGPHLEKGELARAYPVRTTTLTLLELLDPYRFTRGVKVRGKRALEEIMVRRLPAQQVGRTPVSMGLKKRESE
jgi:hypothetical protein